MQIKTFVVPALSPESATDELNAFLRGHKVVTIDRHFVMEQANSFWSFCVTYLDADAHYHELLYQQKKKVDYAVTYDMFLQKRGHVNWDKLVTILFLVVHAMNYIGNVNLI
ncbi:MAG: hypothetical protein KBT32_08495 [Bacteroidales bacterium]|nr:hypothetical protein [Candidatus Physcocola equi]